MTTSLRSIYSPNNQKLKKVIDNLSLATGSDTASFKLLGFYNLIANKPFESIIDFNGNFS